MNEAQRRKIKERQRAQVAADTASDEEPAPPSEPPPPLRDIEEIVEESRPDVPRGIPVAFMRFTSKAFQVAGMQSGETLNAKVQGNGCEHRLEYIAELRHHMVTYIDRPKRTVAFELIPEALVMNWKPAARVQP